MEHPKFRAAYDLLELRAGAENNHELQRLTKWWGEFRCAAPPAQKICSTTSGTIRRRAVVTVVRASVAPRQGSAATLVYIALGSNLASPLEQVQAAIRAPGRNSAQPRGRRLFVLPHRRWCPQDQPDYLNAAVALETALPPRRCSIIPSASNCSRASAQSRTLGAAHAGPRYHAVWRCCH